MQLFAPYRISIVKRHGASIKDISAVAGPISCLLNFLLLLDFRQAFLWYHDRKYSGDLIYSSNYCRVLLCQALFQLILEILPDGTKTRDI